MDKAAFMQRKDFLFSRALAIEAFPNFKLNPWITKMLSNDKEEYYNALDELNTAWKFMYPNDNVTYFPQFARSQVFMAMNDYQSFVDLDDEPMHMRVFFTFHNQIVKHENETQKEQKKRNKTILVEQKERKVKNIDYLQELINKGRIIKVRETKKQKRKTKNLLDGIIAKPKKTQNIIFTLELANNEIPYIDLSSWVIQAHSYDKEIRDSAHDSLNEAFSLRFPESNIKFKNTQAFNRIESGLMAYESIVPEAERNLPMLTFRKVVNSYRARRRDSNRRRISVSQESSINTNLINNNE
ncbi:hypothetical protein GLOIN_2v1639784 [Rhizophagus clarus]|uniref:Uncharacterized protein n=1 Tax=Rhizophagus clarus TaxID=94130 RepID=A0A8H3MF33_9GLOM|nr:hypothetical protein GLOIN_2v1639784 [Rhizophagus clarus]